MNQQELLESSYSKVIYKNYNDKQAEKLVNSYRFRSQSPMRSYKRWSPEIAKEEKFMKKRNREDNYVSSFRPQDRPVLLIKNKHAYKGINNPDIFDEAQ